MPYALNTSIGTRKVTLASTGPYSGPIHNPRYILTKSLLFDDRWMHICGVENVVVRHPTYFHEKYKVGEAYFVQKDEVQSDIMTFDSPHFNAFLDGLYAQPKFLSAGLSDVVFFKSVEIFIIFTFNGFHQ